MDQIQDMMTTTSFTDDHGTVPYPEVVQLTLAAAERDAPALAAWLRSIVGPSGSSAGRYSASRAWEAIDSGKADRSTGYRVLEAIDAISRAAGRVPPAGATTPGHAYLRGNAHGRADWSACRAKERELVDALRVLGRPERTPEPATPPRAITTISWR